MEYGHCSPTVRADFRSGVLRRLRRLGQVGECDDVVVVTACGFVEGSTARDDPESGGVVDVAVYNVGGKVLFGGEVFDTGSGEHCATSVFAGDDDVGSGFEIPQIEEDPVGALPVDVAGDDCRSDLTGGGGSAGVPPCVLPIRWDLECSIGIESEIDDVGVDADGRDFERAGGRWSAVTGAPSGSAESVARGADVVSCRGDEFGCEFPLSDCPPAHPTTVTSTETVRARA